MDSQSKQAAELLSAIGESYYRFLALASELRAWPEVSEVSQDFELMRGANYFEFGVGSPYYFGWYVDISLRNDKSIWWTLTFYWNETSWIIESRIEPGDDGPVILVAIPDRRAETIDAFVVELGEATSELVASAKTLACDIAAGLASASLPTNSDDCEI